MSEWRRRAVELFPDLRSDFTRSDASIYSIFRELVPRCVKAHERNDTAELEKIYSFAEWCANQPAKDLWNAVGVSFFEGLADSEKALRDLPRWVSRSVFEDIAGLLEYRLGSDRVDAIRSSYANVPSNSA
jgi:hypothetical protein